MSKLGLEFLKLPPLISVQDAGRQGMLQFGVSASGPMDEFGFAEAGISLGNGSSNAGIEFAGGELVFVARGTFFVGSAGGSFNLRVNGTAQNWHTQIEVSEGDIISVSPGSEGNFGYLRFSHELAAAPVLGSQSTNTIAGLIAVPPEAFSEDGFLELGHPASGRPLQIGSTQPSDVIRFVWGLHADLFSSRQRSAFTDHDFQVGHKIDRMGIQLNDPQSRFRNLEKRSLVSDIVVPGDFQILGDGSPVILMRDHQTTGGYPRIATIIRTDVSRLAQMRPGNSFRFEPVTVDRAHQLQRGLHG